MAEMRHLLDWQYVGDRDWSSLIADAVRLAGSHRAGTAPSGRAMALLFFNPSLRTRTSMEVAVSRMGGTSSTIVPGQGTWGFAWDEGRRMDGAEAEHIREVAGVLSQYFDAIGIRLFASLTDYEQDRADVLLHRFADAATVPVVNLESAFYHPCQALADAATMTERFGGDPKGRRFVLSWAYHPKALPMAVPNSALLAAARLGMHVTVARPDGFELDDGVMAAAAGYAEATGGSVCESENLDEAVDGAHIVFFNDTATTEIYTDPAGEEEARAVHHDWRITSARMAATDSGAFMHCLPVRRGVVVDDAVMDGPAAIHLRQAAYRLHAQQAIMRWLWQ
jgi:N-acetylornithine carbamoyltransferase